MKVKMIVVALAAVLLAGLLIFLKNNPEIFSADLIRFGKPSIFQRVVPPQPRPVTIPTPRVEYEDVVRTRSLPSVAEPSVPVAPF